MFRTRTVVLNEIFNEVTGCEFDATLTALRNGQITARAYCIELVEGEVCRRSSKDKQTLTTEEWASCALKVDGLKGIHLVDSENCQAHTEITLNSSDVNRRLNFTSQAGGEQPKIGPKVYAYLAAGYAHGVFELSQDPEDLFTELEERSELWDERGPISQNRGVAAIQEFLKVLSGIDQQLSNDVPICDISFASDE